MSNELSLTQLLISSHPLSDTTHHFNLSNPTLKPSSSNRIWTAELVNDSGYHGAFSVRVCLYACGGEREREGGEGERGDREREGGAWRKITLLH